MRSKKGKNDQKRDPTMLLVLTAACGRSGLRRRASVAASKPAAAGIEARPRG
jgi:hypothetical protein